MENRAYIAQRNLQKIPLWKNKTPLLGKLDMELTERCNNNCAHCYINLPAHDPAAQAKELSGDKIKYILKEAVSLGCMTVRFTGGEPLLRSDFEELYIYARKLGLKVLLFTNAALITPQLAGLFSKIPPLEKIEVSVYGMKKSSYEAVTRLSGSFEAAWRGIGLLLKKKIPFVVKGALLPQNKGELEEFDSWAGTIPGMNSSFPYSMFFDLSCRRDRRKNEMIKKIRLSPEEGLKVLTRKKGGYIKEMKKFCSRFMKPGGKKLFSCGSGVNSGSVDAYGYFQPCLLLRHPDTVYNLKEGSLKDALTNFFPKLREAKAQNPAYLHRCARCFLKGFCEQCPAKSWMEHGTLDTPVEYLCAIAHVQARFLGLLEKTEAAWEVKRWESRVDKFCGNQRRHYANKG
jgi:radical SAM protein with 4Fe4S-binding SPASM domain